MRSRPVWMPMYWADYFGDTKHLTTIQHGAYLLLIGHYWLHGKLPDDDRALATIVGMRVDTWRRWHREAIRHFFEDGWRHERVEAELAKARKFSERQRDTANARWQETDATALPARATSPSPSPSPSPSSNTSTETAVPSCGRAATRTAADDDFEKFWIAYPRRGTAANPKKPARDKFQRAVKAGTDPQTIIAAARRYAQLETASGRAGTEKIAQAITWLNQQRWNDYPLELAGNGTGPPQPPDPSMPSDAELRARYGRPH